MRTFLYNDATQRHCTLFPLWQGTVFDDRSYTLAVWAHASYVSSNHYQFTEASTLQDVYLHDNHCFSLIRSLVPKNARAGKEAFLFSRFGGLGAG
jgi:hypothetical protein